MDINGFIEKIYGVIDDLEEGSLTPQTRYREVDAWSSMHALILIAMIKIDYKVIITGDDLMNNHTFEDIFKIIVSRKS